MSASVAASAAGLDFSWLVRGALVLMSLLGVEASDAAAVFLPDLGATFLLTSIDDSLTSIALVATISPVTSSEVINAASETIPVSFDRRLVTTVTNGTSEMGIDPGVWMSVASI